MTKKQVKARKPGPFRSPRLVAYARCVEFRNVRGVEMGVNGVYGKADVQRLAAWLTRAAAWVKEGK